MKFIENAMSENLINHINMSKVERSRSDVSVLKESLADSFYKMFDNMEFKPRNLEDEKFKLILDSPRDLTYLHNILKYVFNNVPDKDEMSMVVEVIHVYNKSLALGYIHDLHVGCGWDNADPSDAYEYIYDIEEDETMPRLVIIDYAEMMENNFFPSYDIITNLLELSCFKNEAIKTTNHVDYHYWEEEIKRKQ